MQVAKSGSGFATTNAESALISVGALFAALCCRHSDAILDLLTFPLRNA